jgi:hypothetical protein
LSLCVLTPVIKFDTARVIAGPTLLLPT